ncbi:hypothetical protein ACFLW3_00305 [Chloroflexota bacterium]
MANIEEKLLKEGWKPASVSGGGHLNRILDMYKELGVETHLEGIKPESCGECTLCFQEGGDTMYRIYTREKQAAD